MINNEYKKLINSKEFKKWRLKYKDPYLSSCVLINEMGTKELWHFDFYVPKSNKITTFVMDEDIIINENQKIFEQSHKKLKEVDLSNIKFDLNKVNEFIEKEFKSIKIIKKIIILQNINTMVWNVSLLGADFNLHNIKIDVNNGKVLDKSATSMLQFKAG